MGLLRLRVTLRKTHGAGVHIGFVILQPEIQGCLRPRHRAHAPAFHIIVDITQSFIIINIVLREIALTMEIRRQSTHRHIAIHYQDISIGLAISLPQIAVGSSHHRLSDELAGQIDPALGQHIVHQGKLKRTGRAIRKLVTINPGMVYGIFQTDFAGEGRVVLRLDLAVSNQLLNERLVQLCFIDGERRHITLVMR